MNLRITSAEDRQKPRILIVEDEAIIALTLKALLVDAGFDVVGVAGRLDAALSLIEQGICDAAILDTNLAGVSAGPAASALTALGLPFIVVSGYLPDQQDQVFSGALRMQKPCRPEQLIQALRSILPEFASANDRVPSVPGSAGGSRR